MKTCRLRSGVKIAHTPLTGQPEKGARYGGFFTLGLLDRYWKPGLTEAECVDIIHKCIKEAKTRFTMAKAKSRWERQSTSNTWGKPEILC